MGRSILSRAKERVKAASVAARTGTTSENARNRPKARVKGNGKADDRLCYGCGKTGHISRNCPNAAKGKGKGKAERGSYYGGKASWVQPNNGIKSPCALVEKPRAHQDLEGFAKPSKTVRPRVIAWSISVNCKTKFFPVNLKTTKNKC